MREHRKVQRFLDFVKSSIGISIPSTVYEDLRITINKQIGKSVLLRRFFAALVRRKVVSVFAIEDAHYGGEKGMIVKIMKELGVKTVEFQHGLVALNHPAYNYSHSVLALHSYQQYLPDYFLTFGDYWNDRIRTSAKAVTVGYPYLLSCVRPQKSTDILVVSDGTQPGATAEMVRFLDSHIKDRRRIVLKLHPAELPQWRQRYSALEGRERVEVLTNTSVYTLLNSAGFVVGYLSTVLLEALAYGHRPLVPRDSYTEEIFEGAPVTFYDSNEQLMAEIVRGSAVQNLTNIGYYWAQNTETRFESFLGELWQNE